ncbi:MAG: glucose-6-phosphate isomerase, partial [Myxococcales bacterium]|nr:glucose-6-phosphate isomerase [Myxococcales bacterium]
MRPVLTELAAYRALEAEREALRGTHLRDLFDADEERFERFSLRLGDLLFDYSKHLVTERVRAALLALAEEVELPRWTERMFAGEAINVTEGRAVLHTALRNRGDRAVFVDGEDVMPGVRAVLAKMRRFTDALRSGAWRGFTG